MHERLVYEWLTEGLMMSPIDPYIEEKINDKERMQTHFDLVTEVIKMSGLNQSDRIK